MTTLQYFCFVICFMSIQSMSIPVIYTEGTHYEVGYDVGKTFQRQIAKYIAHDPHLMPIYYPWSKTSEGKKIVEGFLITFKKELPQYVEELQGTADGSNVSFSKLFLMNMRTELAAILLGHNKTVDDCSDVHVNNPAHNSVAIGHNEDNGPLIKELSYFIVAKIYNNSTGKQRELLEDFTAFSYPGELPGNAFGFNAHGMAMSVNALYPKAVELNKLGRNLLTRAALSLKCPLEIKKFLLNSAGSAYAFSANVGVYGEHNTTIWNMEVAPSKDKPAQVDIMEINPSVGSYYHVNMYRRIKIEQIPQDIVSSKHRTNRIEQLSKPQDLEGIKTILGDQEDTLYPIYRTPRPTDPESTAATAIYDFMKGLLVVYKDNPKFSKHPVHTFRLRRAKS